MLISFLAPSRFEGIEARHLLVFFKQLTAYGRECVTYVGEAGYFRSPADHRLDGRPEWQQSWCETFEYEPPHDLEGVQFRTVPDDLLAARQSRLRSRWRVYGQLTTRRCAEVEAAFDGALASIPNASDAEAVVTFANMPSLSRVAAKRRLPVVHTHFGPLRKPDYLMTGYWDRRGVNSRTDAARRFRAFRREVAGRGPTLLSCEELLHTLRRTAVPDGPDAADAPYATGLALQGEENGYVHGLGALDLISAAQERFRRDDILLRSHPGALTRYSDALGVADTSASATDFILACRTVMTVSSGVAFEAMLLGRRCVVLGDSPFCIAADRSFGAADRRTHRDHLLALNCLAFGYLVPYALMFDLEYTRWRLTDPPEVDILRHHQRWYRERLTASPSSSLTLSTAAKLIESVSHGAPPQPLIVFGAGQATPSLVDRLRADRFELLGVFDNDETQWGRTLRGLPIGQPTYRDDALVLVSSLTYADAIVHQLASLGFPPGRVLRLTQAAA